MPVGLDFLNVQNFLSRGAAVRQLQHRAKVLRVIFYCGFCFFYRFEMRPLETGFFILKGVAHLFRTNTVLYPNASQDVGRAPKVVANTRKTFTLGHGCVQQDFAVVLATGQGVILMVRLAAGQLALLERELVGLSFELLHELGSLHLGQRHERLQVAVLSLSGLVAGFLLQLGQVLRTSALGAGDLLHEPVDG